MTRHYSGPEASVYLGVGAGSIVVLNTASIVFAAVPDSTHVRMSRSQSVFAH
jgi:hypothetical protein